jgi:hypothetical protein
MLVHGVAALHHPRLLARVEQVLLANRAIVVPSPLNALVVTTQRSAVAHPALVAVVEVLRATHSAQAALVAMEDPLLLRFIVEEVALTAEIITDGSLAFDARIRYGLPRITTSTFHLANCVAVKVMVTGVVVTEAARKSFVAARGYDSHV